jgi:hypothetical protein
MFRKSVDEIHESFSKFQQSIKMLSNLENEFAVQLSNRRLRKRCHMQSMALASCSDHLPSKKSRYQDIISPIEVSKKIKSAKLTRTLKLNFSCASLEMPPCTRKEHDGKMLPLLLAVNHPILQPAKECSTFYSSPRSFLGRLAAASITPAAPSKPPGRFDHDSKGVPIAFDHSSPDSQSDQHKTEMTDILERIVSMVEFASVNNIEWTSDRYHCLQTHEQHQDFMSDRTAA